MGGGGQEGKVVPSTILSGGGGGTEVLKSPSLKFFNSYLPILVLQCHFFAHLQNNTASNTGIDIAELIHVHRVNLGIHKSGGTFKRVGGPNFVASMATTGGSGERYPLQGPKIEKSCLKNNNLEAL